MKRTILTLSLSAVALAGGGVAIAQERAAERAQAPRDAEHTITLAAMQQRGERIFARMDANGDGVIDRADRAARQADRFAKMDLDGDGEVSRAEMQSAREARLERRQERREARRNARQASGKTDRFAMLDLDGSGGLSQEEMATARAQRGDRTSTETAMQPARRAAMRMGKARTMLRAADADGNRAVTRAEFDAALMQRFSRLDADNDGTVTAAERKAARESMRQRRSQG